MANSKNELGGSALTSSPQKATIVSLLKSMGAKRGKQKQRPIVLNRNSELFQSYMQQRRPSRSREYPFLEPLFRAELAYTTPSPDKFIGGATHYKPSTPSPPTDDISAYNNIETNIYNYKIIDENRPPISIPPLEVKKPHKTTSTIFKENSQQYVNSLHQEESTNKPSQNLQTDHLYSSNVKEETFPSFQNQFFKYHKSTTPPPHLKYSINHEAEYLPIGNTNEKDKAYSTFLASSNDIAINYQTTTPATIFTSYKNYPVTTIKPTANRVTQKYYMNLVTEQPYQPPKSNVAETASPIITSDYKTPTKIPATTFTPTSYFSSGDSSFGNHKPSSTKSHLSFSSVEKENPLVYYKDLYNVPSNSDEYTAPYSQNSDLVSPEPSSSTKNKFKYEPIDEHMFYYKPVNLETQTEEPKFYYKPAVPDTQTKQILYRGKFPKTTYPTTPSQNAGTFSGYDSRKPLTSNPESLGYSPVGSEIQNATPHPLIYGFKPVKHEREYFSSESPNYRSPKFLAVPSVSTPLHVSQLHTFSPFHTSPAGYQEPYSSPSISFSKPIRFPYDKRHYYSGRFVSTY